MSKHVEALLAAALADLRAKLAAEGESVEAIGMSLFLVSREPHSLAQFSSFAGELGVLGMFAPEWPFALAADLLDEPTEAYEGRVQRQLTSSLHRSAHKEEAAARNDAFLDGFCYAIDELRAKAAAERVAGRLGGSYDASADLLERLFTPAQASPP